MTSSAADEAAGGNGFEWQSELDSAMAELDIQLLHPRRRSNAGWQPLLPELAQVQITEELLDQIASRVARQLQRTPPATVALPDEVPQAPTVESPAQARSGIALTIRVRRPLFRWRFRRRSRRQKAMMLFSDFRVS